MQSAREEKWPSWEKVRRSVHRRSYVIAMTLSCLLLNYGWIRAALWVATRFPGPRSSSLQDVGVNNEFITWPFKSLSQHTLPLPWPPPPASVLLFSCWDGAISQLRWVNVSTFSAIGSSLYSSLNSPWLWLSHPLPVWRIFISGSIKGSRAGNKDYSFLSDSYLLSFESPKPTAPQLLHLPFICLVLCCECVCKPCIHRWPVAMWISLPSPAGLVQLPVEYIKGL